MKHFKRYIMLVERYFRFKFEFVKRLVISFFYETLTEGRLSSVRIERKDPEYCAMRFVVRVDILKAYIFKDAPLLSHNGNNVSMDGLRQ